MREIRTSGSTRGEWVALHVSLSLLLYRESCFSQPEPTSSSASETDSPPSGNCPSIGYIRYKSKDRPARRPDPCHDEPAPLSGYRRQPTAPRTPPQRSSTAPHPQGKPS